MPGPQPSATHAPKAPRHSRRFRWRHSLYSRALLFTVLGSATLLGAVGVQSWIMLEGSVERLLTERTNLAQATGGYLELLIRRDVNVLASRVPAKVPAIGSPEAVTLRSALDSYRDTMFEEGAFVLDARGQPVASVPDGAGYLNAIKEFRRVLALAAKTEGPVVSRLTHLPPGPRAIVIVVQALRGGTQNTVQGYVGGLLNPASNNLLATLQGVRQGSSTILQLVDAGGTVVASSAPGGLFRAADHQGKLTRAIATRTEIRSRCHSCHADSSTTTREVEVLAFVPLPKLDMGVAVRQLEQEALEPAFTLQKRLFWLGFTFIPLFLAFTGLSVHSVVRPLTRLTRAVRNAESSEQRMELPSFGHDEVGILARTLERWRSGMIESLEEVERHRAALRHEVRLTQHHLAVLQEVAEFSAQGLDLDAMAARGLDKLLEFLRFDAGALQMGHRGRVFLAKRGLGDDQSQGLVDHWRELLDQPARPNEPTVAGVTAAAGASPAIVYRMRVLEPNDFAGKDLGRGNLGVVVIAQLTAPQGLEVVCVLGANEPRPFTEARRLESVLRHVVLSATGRLFQQERQLRHAQRREFLHRVLTAQEEERRRVARELHDTVAQDLAALRLALERVANQEGNSPEVATRLRGLEENAHEMLGTVRRILLDLRPSVLDTMGFLPALQWYLERTGRDHSIRGSLQVDGDEVELGREMAVTLFRIFQESLGNLVQHSQAEHALVTVAYLNDRVELTIEDDGVGFDVERVQALAVQHEDHGLGLVGMQERARLLGGEVTFDTKPGQGTTIHVSVPMPHATETQPQLSEVPAKENA